MRVLFVSVGLLCSVGAVWGCSSRNTTPVVVTATPASTPEVRTPIPDCRLIPAEAGQDEAISTVALTEPVSPANAPQPTNESERLLFRQLYETLITADCMGRPISGLAASWRRGTDANTWLIALRNDAHFADGSPLTAAEVVGVWSNGSGLRPQVQRLISSAVAVDDRTLEITLRTPAHDTPLPLAHTDLAVAKRVPGSPWPVGTREAPMVSTAGAITIGGTGFLIADGRDARDLLDEGVDLLISRDRRVLDYAATLPQFVVVPLEWSRTHVFLSPGRIAASPSLSLEAREALAGDAVRGEARGAQGPFWWESPADCGVSEAAAGPVAQSNGRIVYFDRDNVARELAERLVGLAAVATPGSASIVGVLRADRAGAAFQRATGLNGGALTAARQRGEDAGYILQLERRPLDRCREMQVLLESIRWIHPSSIVPLVDTRLRAIVRRGRSNLITEWEGGLLLPGPGR